ncbi:MAG: NfeD family protein [Actinomycetota bacterium]
MTREPILHARRTWFVSRPRNARIATTLSFLAAGLLVQGLTHAASAQPATPSGDVIVLHLDGPVDDFSADYLIREIAAAAGDGAAVVLIEIDTPGGLVSSMHQISGAILNTTVPVVGYVAPSGARAASAGAFILLSCPVAAMAPGTNVGASTPVGLNGGDLGTKITNDAAASIRSIAQTYGRNAEVAETFVTQGASITAEEALAENVIDVISSSQEQLLADLDGTQVTLGDGQQVTLELAGAPVVDHEMGGFFGFLQRLLDPNLVFIFFWLGLALIVLELIVPGHIFSGTVGTAMLIVALLGFGVLPVRIIGIALLILSVVAFIIEIKAPGLGIWGAVGVVALLLGGWFLYDRSGGVQVSPGVLLAVAGFVVLFFGFVVAKALRIRHMPPAQGREVIIGKPGVALGPGVDERGGTVRVSAEEWRAIAPDGLIHGGAQVRVTGLDGLVLTVEPLVDEPGTGARTPAGQGRTGEGLIDGRKGS